MAVTSSARGDASVAGLQTIDLPCSAFGVPAPPVDLDARLLRLGNVWTLLVADGASDPDALRRWLLACGAVDARNDSSNGKTAMRARFEHLPLPWAQLSAVGGIESLRFTANGHAILTLRATAEAAAAAERLLRVHPDRRGHDVHLTARQAELLKHCVQRGYYSIPRRMTLRELGAEIGISATSLSLALRRAEAKIILAFADESAASDPGTDDGARRD